MKLQPRPAYDRALLLAGAKRNAVLDLWEVQRYGIDSCGDADYVSIYGMRPAEWYAKGVRILGRTAVECTRDALGNAIGRDVAAAAATAPVSGKTLIVDLFAGSANTLYWLLRHVPHARGLGFETDSNVFRLTHDNLEKLSLPVAILNADYRSGLADVSLTPEDLLIAFIAPPWGDALNPTSGLDLRRTHPPIVDILRSLFSSFAQGRILCAIQVHERLVGESLVETKERFDGSALHIYALNASGHNHGVMLGSKRWSLQSV